jgi:hypothetical protein
VASQSIAEFSPLLLTTKDAKVPLFTFGRKLFAWKAALFVNNDGNVVSYYREGLLLVDIFLVPLSTWFNVNIGRYHIHDHFFVTLIGRYVTFT